MNSNEFNKETLKQAIEATDKYFNDYRAILDENSGLPVEEVCQMIVMKECNVPQIEAEDIVNDLKKGLAEFDKQLRKNEATEKINVAEQLAEAIKGKTGEEEKIYLANILTVVQLLNEKEVSQDKLQEKMKENIALPVEDLFAAIEKEMNVKIAFNALAEDVKNGLDLEILSALSKKNEFSKEESRLLTAILLYVEQKKGNIKLIDAGIELPATAIGSLAGASIETLIATKDMQEGKMSMERWQKIMKWILGALLGIVLSLVSIFIVAGIGSGIAFLIWSIFGTGMLSIILSMAVAVYVISKLSNKAADVWESFMQKYFEFYNQHIVGITAKVSAWVAAIRAWVENKMHKASNHEAVGTTSNNVDEQNAHEGIEEKKTSEQQTRDNNVNLQQELATA